MGCHAIHRYCQWRTCIHSKTMQEQNKKPENGLSSSHVPDGRTYSVDALTTHWGGTWAYAYPPHALFPNILSKDYIVLLIAPAFLQAQWFQILLTLSIEIPVRLPANRRILNLCRMYSIPSRKHCVFMS